MDGEEEGKGEGRREGEGSYIGDVARHVGEGMHNVWCIMYCVYVCTRPSLHT